MLKNIVGFSFVLVLFFTGCSEETALSFEDAVDSQKVEITAIDGYIRNANVTDEADQIATYEANGVYVFDRAVTYPIELSGGFLEDTNSTFDIVMKAGKGTLISPITTLIYKYPPLGAYFVSNIEEVDSITDLESDYIQDNNIDIAKLSQLAYVMLKDSNLTESFSQTLQDSNSTSVDDVFVVASNEVNASSLSTKDEMLALLDVVKVFTGDVTELETDIQEEKDFLIDISVAIVPLFTSMSTVDLDENNATVLTVIAEDDTTVVYSLLAQDDYLLFTIDANSGVLSFVNAPNYENPLDIGTDNNYSVTVIATDESENNVTQDITISINNIIDLSPTLSNSTGSIAEKAIADDSAGNITIANVGDSSITAITLSGTGSENFSVDALGNITLKVGVTLDYDITPLYTLTAIASNDAGDSPSVNINISVIDYFNPFQIAKIQASDAEASDYFGRSVSISGDYIAVGALYEDTTAASAGSVYIFKKSTDDSITQIAKIQASDAEADDYFGISVSIDGNYIAVGSDGEDTTASSAGSVYIFKIVSDTNVTQIAKIQANDAETYDSFGGSVSMSGDYIAVGATGEDTTASEAGSVYIFNRVSDTNVTQIAKIQASDAAASDFFGTSLSMSGDYIAVASYYEDTTASAAGSVYIFKKAIDDSAVTEIAKIQASDAELDDWFGYSVSMSGDYIAVGAYKEDTTNSGAGSVYIFKIVSDTNVTEISKIQANDADLDDSFGYSVSISGNYIAVGANNEDTLGSNSGSVYIFKKDTDDSITQISKIQSTDIEANDWFGTSVSISGDYIAIGADYEDTTATSAGSVYVFNGDPLNQIYVYNKVNSLTVDEDVSSSIYSIEAVNPNGGIINYSLSGIDSSSFVFNDNNLSFSSKPDYEAPLDDGTDNDYNATIILSDDQGVQTNIDIGVSVEDRYYLDLAKIQASDAGAGDKFGYSVSISGDYIAVGAYWEEETEVTQTGSVYVFKKNLDNTVTQIAKIKADEVEANDYFGYSVSMSGDYIAVGALYEDSTASDSGSVYIFKKATDDSSVTQIAKIQASDAEAVDTFGNAVSISGDYIAVGAEREDTTGTDAGSVYIFKRVSDTNVTQIAKIQASDAEVDDYFGNSVSMSGDYIVVGAKAEDTLASYSGSAYVFKRVSDDNVTEISKIKASDAALNDVFGNSVSISGNYIVVGAYQEDSAASNSGSAYIFKIVSDTNVTEIAKIQASDSESDDLFGSAVSISGDYIAVSAINEDTPTEINAGSVYIFKKALDDSSVIQISKIQASNAGTSDNFGNSVSISGNNVAVGAYQEDTINNDAGSVYIFNKDPNQVE